MLKRFAEPFRPFIDFKRGEGVNVNFWSGIFHRMANVDVIVAVETRMDAALQCDLGGAHFPCFTRSGGDVVEGKEIRSAAQVE